MSVVLRMEARMPLVWLIREMLLMMLCKLLYQSFQSLQDLCCLLQAD